MLEWSCLYEKETDIYFRVKPSAVLKLLKQYWFSNTCAPKIIFLYLHSASITIKIQN